MKNYLLAILLAVILSVAVIAVSPEQYSELDQWLSEYSLDEAEIQE